MCGDDPMKLFGGQLKEKKFTFIIIDLIRISYSGPVEQSDKCSIPTKVTTFFISFAAYICFEKYQCNANINL